MKNAIFLGLMLLLPNASSADCDRTAVLNSLFGRVDPEISQEVIQTVTQKWNKKLIDQAQEGKRFVYWVDDHDQVFFSGFESAPKNNNSFKIVIDPKTKNGYVIKESGEFYYNPSDKNFIFETKSSIDTAPDEIKKALEHETPYQFVHKAKPEFQKAKVLKCSTQLSSQLRGDNFVKDGMFASATVTTLGFVTVNPQILNPTDPEWKEKALLYTADMTGNMASSYVTGKVVKKLIDSNASIWKDFTHRTISDYATNTMIKRPIYDVLLPHDKKKDGEKSTGQKLIPYDTGFSVVRFFPKRAMQRWTMNTLPKLMASACLSNPKLNFIIGPRTVRIADQYTWGLVYQGGRQVYFNHLEQQEKEKKNNE